MTGTNAFTAADLVGVISEKWPGMVLEEFFPKPVFANWFTNLSPFADDSDIFHVPDVYTNDFTVSTQSTQGAEISLSSPTQTDVTLTVNNHVYVAYILGNLQLQQIAKSYDVFELYPRKAAGQLVNDLEGDLAALWSGLTTNTVGDTASVLSDAEVRQSVEKLDSLNIPLEESAWFLHPYVNFMRTLGETLSIKLRKLQGTLSETICSQAHKGRFNDYNRRILNRIME